MEVRFPQFTTLEGMKERGHRISLWLCRLILSRRKEEPEELRSSAEEEISEVIGGKDDESNGTKERTGT